MTTGLDLYVPSKWKGRCGDDDDDTSVDKFSHGTHTLSKAGGRFVNVNYTDFSNKIVKGGAPNARVASYKAIFGAGIEASDEIAAIDEVIHDGVDVLSLSLGSNFPMNYTEDGLAISTLHAVKKGIVSVMDVVKIVLLRKSSLLSETKMSLLNLEGTDQDNIPSVSLDDVVSKALLHYIDYTKRTVTVRRIVKNGGTPGIYKVNVIEPKGISLTMKPKTLLFNKVGQKKSFELRLEAKKAGVSKDYVFGKLAWSDGKHNVTSPIVVKTA
ncbi:Subtilisin-like protease SBT5.3 [Thalictrum thalictroides]|uniref:Subtilisin-like protease SBT5.3 n=1 Tax=Thalictrum thalictroides TaxID=46969 RepID=A0A7J6X8T6_THATH|nr:Subtilisin-like protease SBT5.3 [Thalictrum thalictroides]